MAVGDGLFGLQRGVGTGGAMKTNSSGFSLTELIVVIALISIMLSIVSLDFSRWIKKSAIENQTKEMMADLNDLRMQAIQTKSNQLAVLSLDPNLMTFRRYTSEEPVTTTTGVEFFRKNLKYQVSSSPTATASANDIKIDLRGYTWSWQTLYILPTGSGAIVDCLVISTARVNMGQYNGAKCVFK